MGKSVKFRSGSLKNSIKVWKLLLQRHGHHCSWPNPRINKTIPKENTKPKQAGRKLEASCLLASFHSVGRFQASYPSRKVISYTQLWTLPAIAMPDISRNAHWCNSSKNIMEVPNLFPDWFKSHSTIWNIYLVPLSDQERIGTR